MEKEIAVKVTSKRDEHLSSVTTFPLEEDDVDTLLETLDCDSLEELKCSIEQNNDFHLIPSSLSHLNFLYNHIQSYSDIELEIIKNKVQKMTTMPSALEVLNVIAQQDKLLYRTFDESTNFLNIEEKVAHCVLDQELKSSIIDIDLVTQHIDYHAYGHDLLNTGAIILMDEGVIINNNDIHLNAYSFDELSLSLIKVYKVNKDLVLHCTETDFDPEVIESNFGNVRRDYYKATCSAGDFIYTNGNSVVKIMRQRDHFNTYTFDSLTTKQYSLDNTTMQELNEQAYLTLSSDEEATLVCNELYQTLREKDAKANQYEYIDYAMDSIKEIILAQPKHVEGMKNALEEYFSSTAIDISYNSLNQATTFKTNVLPKVSISVKDSQSFLTLIDKNDVPAIYDTTSPSVLTALASYREEVLPSIDKEQEESEVFISDSKDSVDIDV